MTYHVLQFYANASGRGRRRQSSRLAEMGIHQILSGVRNLQTDITLERLHGIYHKLEAVIIQA